MRRDIHGLDIDTLDTVSLQSKTTVAVRLLSHLSAGDIQWCRLLNGGAVGKTLGSTNTCVNVHWEDENDSSLE